MEQDLPSTLSSSSLEHKWTELAGVGKNWFLPVVLTGLNRLAETPSGKNWQKLAKTQMIKTVRFLVSNRLNVQMCVWMLWGPIVHFPS